MARVSFEKVEKEAAAKLIELRAANAATNDVELKGKLDACKALADTIGKDAAAAAESKVLADWTSANPTVCNISPDEVATIKAAVTSISIATPVAASHSQLLRSDLDIIKAFGITPLRLVHGLLSWFESLPADEQASKLNEWREFALVNRDYSPTNVLRVAGLWDEKPMTKGNGKK